MSKKIGFIGGGNMAKAIFLGLKNKLSTDKTEIYLYEPVAEKCNEWSKEGAVITQSPNDTIRNSDFTFLCVKPQVMEEVLLTIKDSVDNNTLLVSIAAGISTDFISGTVGGCKVIRAMPNTPLQIGFGATALSRNEMVNDTEFNTVKEIFELSGLTEVIDERHMDTIVAVNGSSPAYIYLFAKAVTGFAESYGVDNHTALRLFSQTLVGSAYMLLESGLSADELIKMVSSPGGTTLEALKVFYNRGFEKIIKEAMESCKRRSEELTR